MTAVTLSSKYQLVLPRGARERLRLRPGMKFTVLLTDHAMHPRATVLS